MIAALALPSAVTAKGPPFHFDPNPVYAGKKVRVFGKPGDGCGPGERVTLISRAFPHKHDFAGKPAVYARVKDNGRFSKRIRIPGSRKARKYRVSARCAGGNLGSRKLKVRRY